jgi:hypothetical protein
MTRSKLVFIVVLLFFVTNIYSVIVGKYQYFPYKIFSDSRQYFNRIFQQDYFFFLEKNSPNVISFLSTKALREANLKFKFGSATEIVDDIEMLVKNSNPIAPDREITLPEPSAYVLRRSVQSGTSLPVYIHAPNGAEATIFRLGSEKMLIREIDTVKPIKQSAQYSDEVGLKWHQNLLVPTAGLKPGLYLLDLMDKKTGAVHQLPFVINPVRKHKIAFVAATYTWAAFNNFAGKNFYLDKGTSQDILTKRAEMNQILNAIGRPALDISVPVARVDQFEPFIMDQRPNVPHHSHLLRAAWNLIAFAEEHDIDYGVYTDEDFDRIGSRRNGGLWDAEIIVFGPHTEYWTKNMFEGLRAYLDKGGKVIFAGGNSAFFRVEADSTKITRKEHMDIEISTRLMGTSTTEIADPMFAPYIVKNPTHWIFNGTSLKEGNLFGRESLNHRQELKAKGASGWEADQMGVFSEGFELLARGKNTRGPADMVFKDTPTGGWVFNASSIPFAGALAIDPVISQIMLNLLSGGPHKDRKVN